MTSNKIIDSSKLTMEEINKQIITLKKELLILKIKKSTKQTVKPHLLKIKKNKIAQMLTIKTLYMNKK
uniref:Large ribosomal subunit protein uL29c n=1 Tax=Acrosorium ciliolatum TaxID=1550622 RepID=A0A1Z1M2M9_9FLOR|nr:ribosomal protein L29 [Acrosorium ciliolatum]ARW60044.1 ribosomal protein L29 [Acrosorium ciliolatum]